MKIVFATSNPNKVNEIQNLLPPEIEIISLNDIGCTEEIPETSDTIEGNAIQKANYVTEKYGYDCFAEDTGLEIEALNNQPGVLSARYAGANKNSEDNITKVLHNLAGSTNRKAHFKTVIALNTNHNQHLFTGICEGTITKERSGSDGFGYDPIFKPNNSELTFAQMEMKEKNKISHRGIATRQLITHLTQLMSKK